MAYSAQAIANEFLKLAQKEGRKLTPMHLQKLVYIANGWSLAILDRRLVRESPEAWRFGPVYKDLWDALKQYGPKAVPELIRENNWVSLERGRGDIVEAHLHDDDQNLVSAVYDAYADLHAFQLSALTHNDGTPWSKTYKEGRNNEIPESLIKEHFKELAGNNRELAG